MTLDEMTQCLKDFGGFESVKLQDTGILLGRFQCFRPNSETSVDVEVFDHGENQDEPRFYCKARALGEGYALPGHPGNSELDAISNIHWSKLPE